MKARSSPPQRGAVLLVVLIITTVISLVAGSLLAYSMSERRLNARTLLRYETKNAAEALLEYGAAELSVRFQSNRNFSTSALSVTPLAAHDNRFATLFTSTLDGTRWSNVQPDTAALWVSQTTEEAQRYIDPTNPENDFDPLRGQRVRSQAVRLLARVSAENALGVTTTSWATQLFEVREAALFNYAIFYNLSMEFHPSPQMTIVGPVHSNANSNLTEANGLKFLGTFTTAGTFTAGATTAGRPGGRNIAFTTGIDDNGDGVNDTISIVNPTVGDTALNTYVDSNLSSRLPNDNPLTFTNVASQLWRGFVQDSSHGVLPQNPPGVLTADQARQLILPPDPAGNPAIEAQKFSTQAGLYFFVEKTGDVRAFHDPQDARAYKNAGPNRATWLSDPANANKIVTLPPDLIKRRRLHDFREGGRVVSTVDVDVGVLRTAVAATNSATNFKVNGSDWNIDDASAGWNGIVYFEVEDPFVGIPTPDAIAGSPSPNPTRTAVRLLNGSDLPSRGPDAGMTVATNSATYVVGHYNADGSLQADLSDMTTPEADEVPAAIVADAINVLSQAWVSGGEPVGDVTSHYGTRPAASHTEISCAFLAGIVETSGSSNGAYSGGVENYPRFHENWSNKSLRYRGSIVALFRSQVATGPWSSARYSPPRREWGFNSMYSEGNYPPGTPRLRTYRRLDYRDLTQAQFDDLLGDARLDFIAM